MGLACNDIIVIIIKSPNTGVIPEHRYYPLFFPLDLQGRVFNARFEKAIHDLPLSGIKVMISEKSSEGVVITVVAACLGYIFQFNIRREIETDLFPLLLYLFPQKVGPNNRDISLLESEVSLIGYSLQFLIAPDGYGAYLWFVVKDHLRD